jgi:hypothetical protein
MRSAGGPIGFPTPVSSSSFPTGPTVSTARRPPSACAIGFIPLRASLLSRVLLLISAVGVSTAGTSLGVRGPSSRPYLWASMPRASQLPRPFRPRRFSRPRRLPPPTGSWVYFTPQPRPGFALQGFVPRESPRPPRRMTPCPPVVGAVTLTMLPPSPPHVVSPTGLLAIRESVAAVSVLPFTSTRSPLELCLLQVLPLDAAPIPSHRLSLVAFARADQDPAALAFSDSRHRARHPLARLPTCPRFFACHPSPVTERFPTRRSASPPGGPTEPPTVFGLNHSALRMPRRESREQFFRRDISRS